MERRQTQEAQVKAANWALEKQIKREQMEIRAQELAQEEKQVELIERRAQAERLLKGL
jgi:hypothetical protein